VRTQDVAILGALFKKQSYVQEILQVLLSILFEKEEETSLS
jgi:hypothetical protein